MYDLLALFLYISRLPALRESSDRTYHLNIRCYFSPESVLRDDYSDWNIIFDNLFRNFVA